MQQGSGTDERHAHSNAAPALRTVPFALPSLPLAPTPAGGCR